MFDREECFEEDDSNKKNVQRIGAALLVSHKNKENKTPHAKVEEY
jgi:hypothetical protein